MKLTCKEATHLVSEGLDAFNVLNKKNWANPSSAVNASDFGRIRSALGSRAVQIGGRFTF